MRNSPTDPRTARCGGANISLEIFADAHLSINRSDSDIFLLAAAINQRQFVPQNLMGSSDECSRTPVE